MTCKPEILRSVPLFALLDDDETAVLASQVDIKYFAPRERIYKIGEPSGQAYVMISGKVRVTTVDEDQQRKWLSMSPRKASSLASPPCWKGRPTKQMLSLSRKPPAWK
jgi:CRP-like cAMP-binding protein